MTEEEMLIRAREACIVAGYTRGLGISEEIASHDEQAIREGRRDSNWSVLCAAQALRDLSKPLSEIQPVDPDEEEALSLARRMRWMSDDPEALNDKGSGAYLALLAIKRGRELERKK